MRFQDKRLDKIEKYKISQNWISIFSNWYDSLLPRKTNETDSPLEWILKRSFGCEGNLTAKSVPALIAKVGSAHLAGWVGVPFLPWCSTCLPLKQCTWSKRKATPIREDHSLIKGVQVPALPCWNLETSSQKKIFNLSEFLKIQLIYRGLGIKKYRLHLTL